MLKTTKEESLNKVLVKNVLKSFFKIVLAVVCCFFFLISILFYLAPKFDAKIFNFFGLTKAEEKCYEQIYKNTGSTSDLYNLVVFEMEHNNTREELEFILQLYKVDDYKEFCDKLDASGVKSANGNKSLYIYVADTNAFLKSQEIKCRVEIGIDSRTDGWQNNVASIVRDNLAGDNLTENTFETFVRNVYFSKDLTEIGKQKIANDFWGLITAENSISSEDLINQRLQKIEEELSVASDVQKILLKNSQVQMYAGLYYFSAMKNGDNSTTTRDYKLQHSQYLAEYNTLIK